MLRMHMPRSRGTSITALCFAATFVAYVERVGFSIAYTAMAKPGWRQRGRSRAASSPPSTGATACPRCLQALCHASLLAPCLGTHRRLVRLRDCVA